MEERKEEVPKNFGELLDTELGLCALKFGLVGVFKISACADGIQGCAVTKYTSCVKETLISFFSSPSFLRLEFLVISKYKYLVLNLKTVLRSGLVAIKIILTRVVILL